LVKKLVNKYTEKMLKSAWEKESVHKMLVMTIPAYIKASECKKRFTKTGKVSVPVICVGNLTMGGTGKTPLSIMLAKEALKAGKNPFFLSRGYGGKLQGVLINNSIKYSSADVGDEPLLLSRVAPVVINKNRYEGAKLAINNGADFLIMDDGFQNYTLEKDFSFLVFDGRKGIENGFVLPAGPLREPFDTGLKRANAVVIIRDDEKKLTDTIRSVSPDIPVFYADISFNQKDIEEIKGKKCLAMTALGNPEKFADSLKQIGVEIVKTDFFPDHHFYTEEELRQVVNDAEREDLTIITTEKDAVKIPEKYLSKVKVMPIDIVFKDGQDIDKIKGLLHL